MTFRSARCWLLPLAGFAGGWWAKDAVVRVTVPGDAAVAAAGQRVSESSGPGRLPGKRPRAVEEGFTEADRQRELADRVRMEESCRRKLELSVEEWGHQLELSAGELAALRAAIGPAIEGVDPPVAELALPALTEVLEGMLQGDRLKGLREVEQRRSEALARAKVEARLAEMNAVLLLDAGQEEELRRHLARDPAALPDPAGPASAGLEPPLMAEINRRLVEAGDDGSGFLEVARVVVRESIESRLQGVAEILRPDQIESYRKHLEERQSVWLIEAP